MTKIARLRLISLLTMLVCLIALPSSMAQDVPAETATEAPTEVISEVEVTPTEVVTDFATDIATEVPTEIPTEFPTEAATETAVPTLETEVTPVTPVETEATATEVTPTADPLLAEPALDLVVRDLFQDDAGLVSVPSYWVLPQGWTLDTAGVLQITAAQAGAISTATPGGVYGDVAIMGYFTLVEGAGTAQLIVRESAAGAYVALLDSNGVVTLEKRDAAGVVVSLSSAIAPVQAVAGTARGLRLSVMGSVLRVSVDNIEVIAVQDAAPLAAGTVRVGALFPVVEGASLSGALAFDNFFLWLPTNTAVIPVTEETPAPTQPVVAANPVEETAVPTENTPVVISNGKPTTPQAAPLVMGVMATGNDDFANRLMVGAVPFADSGSTLGNSNEIGEPVPSCTAPSTLSTNSSWYEFTPPAGGVTTEAFTITSQGSSFDTLLAVYTDSNGGAANLADLTAVAGGCNDDVAGSLQARLTLNLTDGTTYYIQLGGYNGNVGQFAFAVARAANLLVPVAPVLSAVNANAPLAPLTNGAKTNLSQPVIAWNPGNATVPFSYEVQIATVANFTGSVTTETVLEPTRFYQTMPLPDPAVAAGQIYYWRVRGRNVVGQFGPYSAVYNFTVDRVPPTPPTLIAPALNGVVATFRPAFTWAPSPTATRYHIKVTTNFSCLTVVDPTNVFDTTVTTTTKIFTTDLPQGEYWFCVEAIDAAGNPSGFGEKRRFIVNLSLTPANHVVIPTATTANVSFTWTAIPGATYRLQVADDSSFSGALINVPDLTKASHTLTNQAPGNYYWRVFVKIGQTETELPQSLARHYTITPPLTVAPVLTPLTTPTKDTTPTFVWNSLSGIALYELQYSTSATFAPANTATVSVNDTTFTVADDPNDLPDTAGTTYYARVRAMNIYGAFSPYSLTRTFVLDTTAPAVPTTLTAPAQGAVISNARPTFSWGAVAGAKYLFELDTDFNTDPEPLTLGPLTAPSVVLTSSLDQGTYFWRVSTVDPAGNQSAPSTPVRSFTIDYRTAPLPNAALIPPTTGATANTLAVTFTWVPALGVPTGTNYTIELDTDPDDSGNALTILTPTPTKPNTVTSAALPVGNYQYRLVSNNQGTSGWWTFFVSNPLPVAPVLTPLTTPTNDTTPTFAWNVLPNITLYELQYSTSGTFAPANTTTVPVNGTTFTVADDPNDLPDTPGTTYYARVRAVNVHGAFGPYSLIRTFVLDTQALAAPTTLTAPAQGAVLSNARPAFSWSAVTGAKYRLEIDTDFGADPEPLVRDNLATPSVALTSSLDQGTYLWHVSTVDLAGNRSAPTPDRSFTIDYRTAPLNNAALIAPTTGATANTLAVKFTWVPALGVPAGTNYVIELDTDPDDSGNPITVLTPGATTPNTVTSAPLPVGNYQYRLVSNNQGTSGWWTFFVSSPSPAAPVLTVATPTNDTTPEFIWTAVTPAPNTLITGYELQLATAATYAPNTLVGGSSVTVSGAGTTSYIWPAALPNTPGTTHYVRVRALTNLNVAGAWASRTFVLDTVAPGIPTLTAPANNATVTTQKPTFKWTAVIGATRYEIRYDTQSDLDVVTPIPAPTPTYIPAGNLVAATIYWQVRAIDAAGNVGNWSSTFLVKITSTGGVAPFVWTTADSTPDLTWTALAWADTYEIQVSRNSTFTDIAWQSSIAPSPAPSATVGITLPNGSYFWRVRAKAPVLSGGQNGPFSRTSSLYIAAP